MTRKIIPLLLTLGLITSVAAAQTSAPDLSSVLEESKVLLTSGADSAACHEMAATLVQLCHDQPASEAAPAALLAAAQLEQRCHRTVNAVKIAQRVWIDYPTSPSAKQAFDLAWNIETRNGQSPLAGTKLALSMAAALQPNGAARFYYQRAFEVYRQNDWWRSAADVGEDYLTHCAKSAPDAPLLMDLSAVALKAGDTDLAVRAFKEFLVQFPGLPQVVSMHTGLAQIYASAGEYDLATDHYSRAWTIYQKNRKKGEYNQPVVAHAAAQALWALQTDARRVFESHTSPDLTVTKSLLREAAQLEEAYRQIAVTDPQMIPQAFAAIGDIRVRLGDALLAEGFRSAFASADPASANPYEAAMPEYKRAVAAFTLAWEKASLMPEDPQARQIVRRASQSAFETAVGEGDALIAWSVELLKYAPQRKPGEEGGEPRFHFVTNRVAPLVLDAVQKKTVAFSMTRQMPVMALAEQVKPGLDFPLRLTANEIRSLCNEEMRAVLKGSSELAGLQAMGFHSTGQTSLMQSLESDFARTMRMNGEATTILQHLYTAGTVFSEPGEIRPYWDSLLVDFYSQQAAVCQSVQTDMAAALSHLSRDDETTVPFRTRLSRLQTKAASQEYAGLVNWHHWTDEYDVQHPGNKEMAARLAKLDPLNYGTPYDLPSASRKGP